METVQLPYIEGVESEEEVGRLLNNYVGHDVLFYGNLIFAIVKGSTHLIIVKYPNCNFYGLSMIAPGYTAIIPSIPKQYMEEFSVGCLSDLGGNKKQLELLKKLLKYEEIISD